MKVHITRGFHENEPYSAGIKRLRSFVSSLTDGDSSINMKVFIKPETSHRRNSYNEDKRDGIQVEAHSGGTRWNPTQDQIRVRENLYKSGVKTPNAQQIEQITVQLGKYGKIEGKNVFYWFQNHKARERQKQKRSGLNLSSPLESSVTITSTTNLDSNVKVMNPEKEIDAYYRRKCRKWAIKQEVELSRCTSPVEQRTEDEGEGENRTLELFPLYPENR